MAVGRPSLYRPEYCDQIYEHMRHGRSLVSFAAEIGVCKDTVYEWAKVHPDFSDAFKKATSACQSWWEEQGIQFLQEEKDGPKLNTALWIYMMKARFKMYDRPDNQAKPQEKDTPTDDSELTEQLIDIAENK